MAHHNLKILPEYYKAVKQGLKTFEIRKNDRNFMVGDTITLQEYTPSNKYYTGNEISFRISYVINKEDYLQPGYVAFSIQPLKEAMKIEKPSIQKSTQYPIFELKKKAEEHMAKLKECMRVMSEEDAELSSDYIFMQNEIDNHNLAIEQLNNAIELLLKN